MGSVALRVRSIVWFVTGALLASIATLMFANAWHADAAPGDTDSTFIGITPCRLADTRPAPARIGPAGTLSTAGTQTFAAVGSNGECTIPTDAVALLLNVTALGASEQTFLTFWPDGDRPLASSLNPAPGQPPVPNAVTVDLSDAGGFNVYNNAGTVNAVIDVNGYYTQDSLSGLDERLSALETAGVDQAVLNRIVAVETSTAGLTTDVAALNSDVAALDEAQPFAVTARDAFESVTASGAVVVSVDVTAPVDGHVTVNSTTNANESTANDDVGCSITTAAGVDADYLQEWESPGANGDTSQIAGTRAFAVAAGATVTYNLVCDSLGSVGSSSILRDSVLTAIFTPAP